MLVIWLRTLQLSAKNLWMHPLRSSLTVLGIFIGVSSVIWLLALGEGISRAAQEQIASLGAMNIIVRTVKPPSDQVADAGYGLTRADYVRLVATVPTITKAIPIRVIPAVEFRNGTRKMEGRIVGTTPDYAEVNRLVLDRGRFLSDADLEEERNYCVLAAEVAERMYPIGEAVGQRLRVKNSFYQVVGVMKPRLPSAGIGGSISAEVVLGGRVCADHDAVAARRGHDHFDQAGPVPARDQRSDASDAAGGRSQPRAVDGRPGADDDRIRPHVAGFHRGRADGTVGASADDANDVHSCSWA